MKIKLIFYDWFRNGKSLANTTEGVNLSICDFHAGSTFDGDIELNEQQSKILKSTIHSGYEPVFIIDTEEVCQ